MSRMGLSLHPASGCPINHLPSELLVEIVRHYARPKYHLEDLNRLAQVCRLWRLVIEGTPSLWSTIDGSQGIGIASKALSLAGHAPLNIICQGRLTYERVTLFKLYEAKIDQWRSLVIKCGVKEWDAVENGLLAAPPPNLVSIQISSTTTRTGRVTTIFGGNPAPVTLSVIDLEAIPIDLSSLHLSHLRELSLTRIPRMRSQDLIAVIADSPDLAALTLKDLDATTSLQETHAVRNPIHLPHLRKLSLENLNLSFFKVILSIILAPNLEAFEIGGDFSVQQLTQLFSFGMHHHIPTLTRMISNVQEYTVIISGMEFYLVSIGPFDLIFDCKADPMGHFAETFNWLHNNLGRDLKHLPLDVGIGQCQQELVFLEWFTQHTTVTSLGLWCGNLSNGDDARVPAETIEALSQRRPVDTSPWLVPNVEILRTNYIRSEGSSNFLTMIERRHFAAADGAKGEQGNKFPKPFRELRLWCGETWKPFIEDGFMEKVQKVAPNAEIYREERRWSRTSS